MNFFCSLVPMLVVDVAELVANSRRGASRLCHAIRQIPSFTYRSYRCIVQNFFWASPKFGPQIPSSNAINFDQRTSIIFFWCNHPQRLIHFTCVGLVVRCDCDKSMELDASSRYALGALFVAALHANEVTPRFHQKKIGTLIVRYFY
jgi:hypothetical protein